MSKKQATFAGVVFAALACSTAAPALAQSFYQNNKINVFAFVGVSNNQDTTLNQTGQLNFGFVAQRGNNVSAEVNQTGNYLNGVYVNQSGGGAASASVHQTAVFNNYSFIQQGWSFTRR